MNKSNDKLDATTNRLFAQLPKQIVSRVQPIIEQTYDELAKPSAFVEYTDAVAQDTILCLKLLTYSQEKVLVVTHD